MFWNGWPLERVFLLLVGIGFLMIFIQVTIFHYRQNFQNPAQWLPVAGTPALGLILLFLSYYNSPALSLTAGVLLTIGALLGMGGFYYHVRGISERVDGFQMQNILVGPPITLPLMVSAMSIFGLFAIYWRY